MSSTRSYQFLELDHVSYFSYNSGNVSIPGLLSREECETICFKNCSCKVAFVRYVGLGNISSGYCYPESSVYSLKMNSPSDVFYNSIAYIKVRRNPKHTKRSVIGISVSVSGGMVVLFFVLWVWIGKYRKGKQKQRKDEIDDDD